MHLHAARLLVVIVDGHNLRVVPVAVRVARLEPIAHRRIHTERRVAAHSLLLLNCLRDFLAPLLHVLVAALLLVLLVFLLLLAGAWRRWIPGQAQPALAHHDPLVEA